MGGGTRPAPLPPLGCASRFDRVRPGAIMRRWTLVRAPRAPALPSVSARQRVLAVVALGTLVVSLDSTVNVALPAMTAALGAPIATLQWIIITYVLTNTSLVLGFGRLADMIGRRRVWTTGLFALSAALVGCGLAQHIGQLILARGFQAVGAAMILAASAALVTGVFPAQERGRALGLMAMGASAGGALGPLLGGALVNLFGWQAVFLGRAPIALAAGLLSLLLLPKLDEPRRREPFDFLGAALLAATMVAFLMGLNRGPAWGWSDRRTVALFAAAPMLLAGFILRERTYRPPVIDLRLFRDPRFGVANACGYLSSLAMFGVWLLVPYYLVEARGLDALRAGWFLACVPAATALSAPVGGWVADRRGLWLPALAGLLLEVAGLLLIARLEADSPAAVAVLSLVTLGVGLGVFQAPNQSAVMGAVPASMLGVASGMLSMMRTLGVVSGVAVLGAVYAANLPAPAAGEAGRFSVPAFQAAFTFAAAVAVVASIISAGRRVGGVGVGEEGLGAGDAGQLGDGRDHAGRGHRFAQMAHEPGGYGAPAVLGAHRRQRDHRRRRRAMGTGFPCAELGQELVAVFPRHANVSQHHLRPRLRDARQPLGARRGHGDRGPASSSISRTTTRVSASSSTTNTRTPASGRASSWRSSRVALLPGGRRLSRQERQP
ncbi:MAG: DHA2 family efflux MFS transporter permease subunit [Dehalococcoidia bacterium]